MNTTARILAAAVAVLALTLSVGAGTLLAASPAPTVGGTLSALGKTITVESLGNVPAHVHLTADTVSLSETDFDLATGASHKVTYTGAAAGYVTALYTVIPGAAAGTQELGSATLQLRLHDPVLPAFGFADLMPGGSVPFVWIALLILAFLLPARWFRRNVRIVRKAA